MGVSRFLLLCWCRYAEYHYAERQSAIKNAKLESLGYLDQLVYAR